MEKKIGETFEFEGRWLKVKEEDAKNACRNCYLVVKDCSMYLSIIGECLGKKRSDNKDIVFEDITHELEEQSQKEEQKEEQPLEQTEQPQSQKLNLCEVLKYCPEGEPFWSPMLGDVKFYDIKQRAGKVRVQMENWEVYGINTDGTITICGITSPEIMLYPSRKQRDWSKFTAPWLKKDKLVKPKFKVGDIIRHKETNKDDVYEISEVYDDSYGIVGFNWRIYMKYQDQYELVPNKFDPKTLKPFDRVLSKFDGGCWSANLFSHIEEEDNEYYSTCSFVCNGSLVKKCIPYNDETKHLVGTTDEAPDFYRYWED